MLETQIYLTEKENDSLQFMARQQGQTSDELIKAAITKLLNEFDEETLRKNLMAAAGIWRDRDDIPDLHEMRRSAERF
ncbi:transcriptional regulator, CopG family protein [Beggiatoa sp. PS]|nr:transcriptional regulator, CopG family protein [Beggiatoa sp. PS]